MLVRGGNECLSEGEINACQIRRCWKKFTIRRCQKCFLAFQTFCRVSIMVHSLFQGLGSEEGKVLILMKY